MAGFDLGNTLAGVLDTVPSRASVRTPEIIGEEIRSLVSMANRTTLWFALEIGRRLTEAKALVGHGGWLGFLKDHTEFSERKAQDLMRVYRAYGGQSSLFGTELANPQAFADLDYTKAVALLAQQTCERMAVAVFHAKGGGADFPARDGCARGAVAGRLFYPGRYHCRPVR